MILLKTKIAIKNWSDTSFLCKNCFDAEMITSFGKAWVGNCKFLVSFFLRIPNSANCSYSASQHFLANKIVALVIFYPYELETGVREIKFKCNDLPSGNEGQVLF